MANEVNGVARQSRYGPVSPNGVMKHVRTDPPTQSRAGDSSTKPIGRSRSPFGDATTTSDDSARISSSSRDSARRQSSVMPRLLWW